MRMLRWFCAPIFFGTLFAPLATIAQTSGPSVNMVSGTGWTNGDPFLQRQNEPSLAVSTRNTLHLFGGANDYRSVDIAGLAGQSERADAWLGVFKSFDGGQTWQSTLLPGFPLDGSPVGMASPLHGFQAAADPTVRAGTNGLFYYSGIAFNRGTNAPGVVFVARFIDNDNKENGDATHTNGSLTKLAPTDPIQYVGTVIVDSGNSGQFLDKPWIATDVPRGTATCSVPFTKPDGTQGTQTIPAGQVYLVYTSFNGNLLDTKIMFSSSQDCGATWDKPVKLSESNSVNQGTIVVVDPSSTNNAAATIYAAWRRFATSSQPDAMMIAKSTDGGNTWTKAIQAVTFPTSCSTTPTAAGCAFDQGTSTTTFRTSAYPALTVDDAGRVYLAWSQRQASGDARIMTQESLDGLNWASPPAVLDNGPVLDDSGNPFSNLSGRGHQLMPSLSFNAGKISIVYFDFRQDHTLGFFKPLPDLSGYVETRQFEGELIGNPGSNAVFNPFVSDAAPLTTRRHTIDVQGAQASPLPLGTTGVPSFAPFRISRYLFGINPFDASEPFDQAEQLQIDAPDLPMFEQGTVPFFGDYIDVAAAPPFLLQSGKWVFNTNSANSPVFHAVWTDNRDVVPPPDGNWMQYAPPFSASNPAGSLNTSVFDPTQTVTPCQIKDGFVASRNQNIYTSIVSPGLVVGSLGNSKPLGFLPGNPAQLLERAFAVTLRNTTTTQRSFRISIGNQPLLANGQPDPQGQASLLQFSLQTSLDVTIGPQSSIARVVFIQSANPAASVTVNAQEITAPNGSLVPSGLTGFVTFNPDPNTPQILDPDNFGFANPGILSAETHNPAIGNPAIGNPAIGNFAIINPAIGNPAIGNPAIGNPAIGNPSFVASLTSAISNPAIIGNPAIGNPAIGNPAIGNQSVTDATYPVTNEGNTTTPYTVKLFQKAPLPAGVSLQLILTKQYLLPSAHACNLVQQIQNVIVVNVPNPVFTPAANLGNPDLSDPAVTNATLALEPGETGQIVIRANVSDPNVMHNLLAGAFTPVVVAQPANTGFATPPATLTILSSALPDAVVSNVYSGPVNIFGGFGGLTVSLSNGSLPPGVSINPTTGVISGTPTTPGNYAFTVQVTDSLTPPAVATQTYTLHVAPPLVITAPKGADGVVNVPYSLGLTATGGTGNDTWSVASGTLPSGLSLSATGAISGTPTQVSLTGNTVTLHAQDSGSPAQTSTVTITIRIAPALTISTSPGALPNAIIGVPYTFTFQSSGGITPIVWTLASGQLPPGLSLNSNGTVGGTPTATGSFTFTVQAGDASSPSQTITINVAITSAPLLVITSAGGALPDAIVGKPYSVTLLATGGTSPLTWTLPSGQLPAGLTLSTAGVLSGTPTAANPNPTVFTVQVQDSGAPAQSKTLALTIRVPAPLAIVPAGGALPEALASVAYSTTLSTTGGIGPVMWSVTSGSLPPGITLSAAGVISGTSGAVGNDPFTVQAADSGSPQQQAIASYTLTVASSFTVSFAVQPGSTQSQSQITPSVKVLVVDNFGNPVRGAVVQLSIAVNPGGGTLTGQTVQTTGQGGLAVFGSLGITAKGNGYQLMATVTSPAKGTGAFAISAPFNIF